MMGDELEAEALELELRRAGRAPVPELDAAAAERIYRRATGRELPAE